MLKNSQFTNSYEKRKCVWFGKNSQLTKSQLTNKNK